MPYRTYIFAGGGTGGHLYPALAVAEELARLEPESRVVFACSDREIDKRILEPSGHAFVPQPIRPMPRKPTGWLDFARGWFAARAVARDLVRDLKPDAVFGLGGFAAEPVVKAASGRGVPCCLLSIDAVPGVANRHLAGSVQAIFAQFPETPKAYGANLPKVQVIGCPVRRRLLGGDRAEAMRHFGLHEQKKTLFIVPGSLGALSINQAIPLLASELDGLAESWQILHVTGPGKLDQAWRGGEETAVRSAECGVRSNDGRAADFERGEGSGATAAVFAAVPTVRGNVGQTESSSVHVVPLEFCDRMDLAYAAADLVLCRAGASTVGELVATGTPAVLMPYPYHKDDHQRHNTHEVVSAGACIVVDDTKDAAANAAALKQTMLAIMADPARLAAMRQAARGLARTDAAERIVRWLMAQGGSR